MSPVARYTRFVLFGRGFLWVLVAIIVIAVIWAATMGSDENGKRIVFTNVPKMTDTQNVMTHPRYQGLDTHNQPYTIIADRATQVDKDHVALAGIRADMLQRDGKWVALTARDGMLDTPGKQLELSGGVNLFYEDGYEMRTDHAHVDIHAGSAYGDSHVEGQGPAGTLAADGFEAFDRGQRIVFKGSVTMRIYRDE